MKVLVTGGTGFVGSWMAHKLLNSGHEVSVLMRQTSSRALLQDLDVQFQWGDVTDPASVQDACRGMDAVFHLAGFVGYSPTDRSVMERVNVQGTENIIAGCAKNAVKRLVHMRSVVAVGAAFKGQSPLNEDSPYNLKSLNLGYFETKRAAEIKVMEAVRRGEIDAVILNPSTIYGAGDFTKSSRRMQLKVARGKMPFYTSGGVSIIGIDDVINATYAAWERGKSGERYILSGDNVTIKELFAMVAAAAHMSAPKIMLPDWMVKIMGRAGDVLEKQGRKGPLNTETAWTSILYHWFDSSKAQRELGLKPQPAAACIAASVGWAKDNGLL